MKAARITTYGDAEVVKVVETEVPTLTENKVLVEVHAASLNPFDAKLRSGAFEQGIPLTFPATLGGDIAGIVTEVGTGVTTLQPGDKVYGQANIVAGNSGAFAEYAATDADQVALMPENLEFPEAAALPLTGVSALQVITGHLKLQAEQKILIHGGAGGIGTIAIQLAKHLGAYVATTATGDGLDHVKALGADVVIDYTSQNFSEELQGYDAVFDTVGGATYADSFKVLAPGGVIVSMVMPPDAELMAQYNVTAILQQTKVTTEALTELAGLVDQGVIRIHIDSTFDLEAIVQAFQTLESGKAKGKVVVTMPSQG